MLCALPAGFHRRTPLIEFVRKGRDMLSLEGEKLHVAHVTEAGRAVQANAGVSVVYYRAVGDRISSRYDLLLELEQSDVPDQVVTGLGQAIDLELAALNSEYGQKRRSGRLTAPVVKVMAPGWGRRRMEAKLARHGRDTQFKDQLLGLPDPEDRAGRSPAGVADVTGTDRGGSEDGPGGVAPAPSLLRRFRQGTSLRSPLSQCFLCSESWASCLLSSLTSSSCRPVDIGSLACCPIRCCLPPRLRSWRSWARLVSH